jgi:hypothetical protein
MLCGGRGQDTDEDSDPLDQSLGMEL